MIYLSVLTPFISTASSLGFDKGTRGARTIYSRAGGDTRAKVEMTNAKSPHRCGVDFDGLVIPDIL